MIMIMVVYTNHYDMMLSLGIGDIELLITSTIFDNSRFVGKKLVLNAKNCSFLHLYYYQYQLASVFCLPKYSRIFF